MNDVQTPLPGTCVHGEPAPGQAVTRDEDLMRKRFTAAAIDYALAFGGFALLFPVHWFFGLCVLTLYLIRDWGECYSPGKRAFNLAAVGPTGRPCSVHASVLRNVTLLPPFVIVELLLFIFSRRTERLGDSLASTRVVWLDAEPAPDKAHGPSESIGAVDESGATIAGEDAEAAATSTAPAGQTVAVDMFKTDVIDAAIIDAGLMTPDRLTPEEMTSLNSLDAPVQAESVDMTPSLDGLDQIAAASEAIDAAVAARCLGIDNNVTYDTLDDAYWQHVERYSPDAVANLEDEELRARCSELAAAKSNLPLPQPALPSQDADRHALLTYLNKWFILINQCRDVLS